MSAFQLRRYACCTRLRTANFALALAALVLSLVPAAQVVRAQTFTVLHSFQGTDGLGPNGDLVLDSKGNLYGTTSDGGATGGTGTVFKLDKNGRLTILHHFSDGADGGSPLAGVVRDAAGNLYGTTESGGTYGAGVVFKLDAKGHETVLHSFAAGRDGASPWSPVVLDAAGNVYGTTYYGGRGNCDGTGRGCGVVFKVSPTGQETLLYRFAPSGDGRNPTAGLLWGPSGTLYGTTFAGGSGQGTVFKVNRRRKESVVYQFGGMPDGAFPQAGLIWDAQGNLYGATEEGGTCYFGECGTIFRIEPDGHETVLYKFSGYGDGHQPLDRLVLDKAGNLYGTTDLGGDLKCGQALGCGVVFRLRLRDGKFTVLHTFKGKPDGSYPSQGLVLDESGNLYGAATLGGRSSGYGNGTVFKIKP
jgi:uncharacterized repeat protein (TIGR03803 family)